MVKVKFYGTARVKFGVSETEQEAKNIKELLQLIGARYDVRYKELKQFVIYVNEVNIYNLHKYHTKLKNGDSVMLVSPSSGG